MMYWYGTGGNGWDYALMMTGMVLFWGLLVIGIVVLVRYLARAGRRSDSPPEQVLAQRYARGEIDEDEYQRRLDTLRHSGQPAGP